MDLKSLQASASILAGTAYSYADSLKASFMDNYSEVFQNFGSNAETFARSALDYSYDILDRAQFLGSATLNRTMQGTETLQIYFDVFKNSKQFLVVQEFARAYLHRLRIIINNSCVDLEPWNIILYSVAMVYFINLLFYLWNLEESLPIYLAKRVYSFVKNLPGIRLLIRSQLNRTLCEMKQSILRPVKGEKYNLSLPEKGLSKESLIQDLKFLRDMGKVDWKGGRISGTVYHGGQEWTDMLMQAYSMFAWANPLHPDVFPGCRKMEAEVVNMCVNMFQGGPDACGTMTSGGTESILMACKAYREWGAKTKGITEPDMVVPNSIHAAFDKAAEYFKIKIIHVPVDPITKAADVRAMSKKITKNTIFIAGSCPSFPHGIIDPITELATLARRHQIGLHVDCCLGGFLVPFMAQAGFDVPLFDFRIPAVTSISVDTHKYGYAPKGSSCILYRSKEIRQYQYFVAPNWPGGVYACPSVAGSRSGAVIAATWAAMMSCGVQGYVTSTKAVIDTARYIETGLRKIHGLSVLGNPKVSVIAFTSEIFDIYRLGNELSNRGWNLNNLQFPSCIHLCVTLVHTRGTAKEDFLRDVRESVQMILQTPKEKTSGMGAIYGMAQSIPDRSFVDEIACGYIDCIYEARPCVK